PGRDAEDIADDTADASVCSAKRLDGGGVVMGLDLERDFVVVVEVDDAGVVGEGGAYPGLVDFFGGGADVSVQEAIDKGQGDALTLIDGNTSLKGFVDAVLAPGLGDGLELDVGGVAPEAAVVMLDGLHLTQVERGAALAR